MDDTHGRGDDANVTIDRLGARVLEASTSDRQADDVHIFCIDDVAARAIDMADLNPNFVSTTEI